MIGSGALPPVSIVLRFSYFKGNEALIKHGMIDNFVSEMEKRECKKVLQIGFSAPC